MPTKLSEQVQSIKNSGQNLGLVYSRCEFFRIKKTKKGNELLLSWLFPGKPDMPTWKQRRELYKGNIIPFSSVIYWRGAIEAIGGFPDQRFCRDYFMNIAIASKFDVVGIDKFCVGIVYTNSSLTSSSREIGLFESLQAVERFFC